MKTGRLRVYLGAAPGVGKTFAMLDEAHRRCARGKDVVIGLVETHGRLHTAERTEGLEVVPPRTIEHRGIGIKEMDVDAILARRPEVVLVDELAHSNAPGSRHAQRWQDVEDLLAAGIDVVTTVNIQHLESLNDVVESITGIRQQETVPDRVVRQAAQIELVDMSPDSLRRRLAHGNVYKPETVDAALANYFRVGNLTALRELALLWVADRVEDALDRYRAENDIEQVWPARERVVVALDGGPDGERLIRRGARVVQRVSGGELMVLHVSRSDGLSGAAPDALARQRLLVERLGGTFHSVMGEDVAQAVIDFCRGVNATQLVLGASRHGRLRGLLVPGISRTIVRGGGDVDVLLIPRRPEQGSGKARRAASEALSDRQVNALGRRRLIAGWLLAIVGTAVLSLALYLTRDLHDLSTELMLFLALTVAVALVGGMWPALAAAVLGGVVAGYVFTPPYFVWTITGAANIVAVVVLLAVAISVSVVVDAAARRTVQAARARAEADTLAHLAGSVLRGEDTVAALLAQLRETFGLVSVSLLEHGENGEWTRAGASGDDPPNHPDRADALVPVTDGLVVALVGGDLPADRMRVVTAVAVQAGALLERDRLRAEARAARGERDRTIIRTALLAAVSHDLRTPLAGIKASISSLRAQDVQLSPEDEAELLGAVEESADRLQGLVDNLLDMSRLDSGVVVPVPWVVALDEVVPGAVSGVPGERIVVDVPPSLPPTFADPGLLERVIANVVENAVRHSPPTEPVRLSARVVGSRLLVRISDRGPGVPDDRKEDIFRAFQRLGDAPSGQGVGLGLAVARGFAEANGAHLDAEDTPGGGLTLVLSLPVADVERHPEPHRDDEPEQPSSVQGHDSWEPA